jgi:hypothetical protein
MRRDALQFATRGKKDARRSAKSDGDDEIWPRDAGHVGVLFAGVVILRIEENAPGYFQDRVYQCVDELLKRSLYCSD